MEIIEHITPNTDWMRMAAIYSAHIFPVLQRRKIYAVHGYMKGGGRQVAECIVTFGSHQIGYELACLNNFVGWQRTET